MKIYTKTGDQGETGLLGGVRVAKHHPCIKVCGALDELNSWIGVVRSQCGDQSICGRLEVVQVDLFCIGAAVACCLGESKKKAGVGVQANRSTELEGWIDDLESELPPQTAFILPGGSPTASWIHLARNVCRRAERELVGLIESLSVQSDLSGELVYLNRLGDLLFLLARAINVASDQGETEWLPE